MDHGNACHAHRCQMRYRFLRLALVTGADVENLSFHRLVQEHGTGRWPNQRHIVLGQQRHDGFGMRCATVHEQRQHFFVFNQDTGIFCRLIDVKFSDEASNELPVRVRTVGTLCPRIVNLLRQNGMDDTLVLVGGIVPQEDIVTLKANGVSEVFLPGTSTEDIVRYINANVRTV